MPLRARQEQFISRLINLTETRHDPARLARHGLSEVHLPVRDFTAPTEEQIDRGIAAIRDTLGAGQSVAVHCGGGLGRTGTLLTCYLVDEGLTADAAIERMRTIRPGSVETRGQAAAVRAFAARRGSSPR